MHIPMKEINTWKINEIFEQYDILNIVGEEIKQENG